MNLDLFGEGVYKPMTQVKSLLNVAHGFDEFWKCWPNGPRKAAKQQCLNKWAKLNCCQNASLIVAHVEAMKKHKDWTKDEGAFIPAPLVYLNQARWEASVEQEIDQDSKQAIEALAARHGLARWDEFTEQWPVYKARIKKACAIH
jgi:hypothetical protein